jgi:phospholipase C
MKNIQHIVYLMLENRSLDNVLGWLYENDAPLHFIPKENATPYNGLQTGSYSNPDGNGNPVPVTQIAIAQGQTIPAVDPNEDFLNVQQQISNNMQGFYLNFATTETQNPAEIMETYTPDSLPVINSLAKQFAVSDTYFSSIPTQTNCNRAFSLTGNSIGYYHYFGNHRTAMVNNYWEEGLGQLGDPYTFTERCIWSVLAEHNYLSTNDWQVFYNQTWPGGEDYEGSYCFTQDLLWPTMSGYTNNFNDISQFFSLAASGNLPTFSYLEPTWYEEEVIDGFTIGHMGSDYHPPANVGCGEQFLYSVYQALKASPNWVNTILIVNFDEHGGTYDHEEPTAVVAAPWDNSNEGTLPPYDYDIQFSYARTGVRVPLILASPLIEQSTLLRSATGAPFDHTSVIATILDHFRIPRSTWGLGSRTASAPTFKSVITLHPTNARTNVDIAAPLNTSCDSDGTAAPNDLQTMIMHRFLRHVVVREYKFPLDRYRELYHELFQDISTIAKLNAAARNILARMKQEMNQGKYN